MPKNTGNFRRRANSNDFKRPQGRQEFGRPVVIIPAFNEQGNIGTTLSILKRMHVEKHARILVVDDGSTDKTAEVAERLGASVLRLTENSGKAFAFMTAIKNVQSSNPSAVVTIDADMVKIEPRGFFELLNSALKASNRNEGKMFVTPVMELRDTSGVNTPFPSGIRSFSSKAINRLSKLRTKRFSEDYHGYGLEKFLNFFFRKEFNALNLTKFFTADKPYRKGKALQHSQVSKANVKIKKISEYLKMRASRNRKRMVA
ncbi:MAG: glycosyltransferase [Candidatus Diapherotrites archaeon]|nr:glycosyltransferase [Candidatus Diapherotrites archaeon]